MSTFDYLTPAEAVTLASAGARDFETIIGRKGADADRFMQPHERTRAGYLRKPSDPWRAHAHMDHFKEIASVAYARDGADTGTILVTFADGTDAYLSKFDLLCVERPI